MQLRVSSRDGRAPNPFKHQTDTRFVIESIVSSPIKHEQLAANKNSQQAFFKKQNSKSPDNEKYGTLLMDPKELEAEKELYYVYNANGNFFCDCSLCKENDFNTN